jgi:kinetochore protein NDC80
MNGCIQHLIQYLTENNYDKPISMRTLSAPSQQDFKQIVEFLFMQVDPSFRLCIPDHASNKRPEEEIPVLFKHLKYPFQMSSRSLLSVGSPHTWPALLAALHWLIELLVYDEVARHTREEQATAAAIIPVDDSGAPMQQYAPMDRLFFAFVTEAYGAFMAGLDDADQLENDFIQTYEERNQQLCYTTEAIQANTRQISNDMTVLANDKNRVHNLKEKLALLQRDNEKFKNLISSLEAHKKQAQKKRQDCVAELQRQEQELAALQAERAQLDSIFRKQQAEELDVDKINKERTELEENISIESSHRQQIEQSVQGQEMELSKKFDYAEQRIAVFNQMCRQQGLVRPSKAGAQQFPSTPVRASSSYMPSTPGTFRDDDTNSVEYFETEMRFNPYAQQMLSHDAKAFVKPQLKRFLQVTRQRLAHQQEQLFQLNETIDQLEDTIKMERATLNDAVVQAHAVESNYQRNREAFDESQRATEAAISMEIDSTRTRFAEHKARLLQLEQSKSLAERQLSEKKDKYQRERDQLATAMMQVIDMVANHKQLISDKLSSLLSHMRSKKQEFDQFAQIQSLHMNLHRRQSMNQ